MIYDCFLFFKELDLLEIRLHELAGVVDKFVLVEAGETFTGKPKPYTYLDNIDRFKGFDIIRVEVPKLPNDISWNREAYQRNAILRGLQHAKDDDMVLLGDVDEIPRRKVVRKAVDRKKHVVMNMKAYMYHVNNMNVSEPWQGTQIMTFDYLFRRTPEGVRRERWLPKRIPDGGWHYSGLVGTRGIDAIREKLTSFSHTECNRPEWVNDDNLTKSLASGQDPCGKSYPRFETVNDGDMPKYLRDNQARFSYLWR